MEIYGKCQKYLQEGTRGTSYGRNYADSSEACKGVEDRNEYEYREVENEGSPPQKRSQ